MWTLGPFETPFMTCDCCLALFAIADDGYKKKKTGSAAAYYKPENHKAIDTLQSNILSLEMFILCISVPY